ncbi:ABC transporter permease [Spiroplasma diminutum]|uniref:Uncharacterized protein n=1 Tax=Spiroplasma diminutum CUAS-1 TaxID=1276221 RepID=S5MJB6_9MOLU|nr:ABC transporter permease [Spiroplasma diminutum]AGR42065.1 hypothetical protein SDIMI_v3c03610 [Spiroplasma diminutum CUAS-1]
MQNFKLLFSFSLKRILKSKSFKILFFSCISINLILNLLFFGLLPNYYMISAAMLSTSLIGILFLSFLNINNIVAFIIQDSYSGIQGVQIRRGSSIKNIFLSKICANKIVTFLYILITYLLFLLAILPYNFGANTYILFNFSLGVFALVPFDLFITAIALFLSVLFKKYKISLSISWILYTLLTFQWLFGPLVFAFAPIPTKGDADIIKYNANELYKLSKKYKNGLSKSLINDYVNFNNIVNSADENYFEIYSDKNIDPKLEKRMKTYIYEMFFYEGLLMEFYNLLDLNKFETSVQDYLKNFKIDYINISINTDIDLKEDLNDSLTFSFLKSISEPGSGEQNIYTYKNSYFYKTSKNNYSKMDQLQTNLYYINSDNLRFKEFTDKNNIEINTQELLEIKNIFKDLFKYHYSWNKYKKLDIIREEDGISNKPNKYSLDNNPNYWVKNMKYSQGTRFFNIIFKQLLSEVNYPNSNKSEYEYYLKYQKLINNNYKWNPFMSLYNMFYFSGKNNFQSDSIVLQQALLPIADFRILYKENENDEEQLYYYNSRPFNIILTYSIWIIISLFLLSISYFIFNKMIYKKGGDQ